MLVAQDSRGHAVVSPVWHHAYCYVALNGHGTEQIVRAHIGQELIQESDPSGGRPRSARCLGTDLADRTRGSGSQRHSGAVLDLSRGAEASTPQSCTACVPFAKDTCLSANHASLCAA